MPGPRRTGSASHHVEAATAHLKFRLTNVGYLAFDNCTQEPQKRPSTVGVHLVKSTDTGNPTSSSCNDSLFRRIPAQHESRSQGREMPACYGATNRQDPGLGHVTVPMSAPPSHFPLAVIDPRLEPPISIFGEAL
ncbi:hypothetical protein CGCS363_v004738 [Colletotrichum siamense]|uniref:uncharacterized protein n=1 Tax=Colletotrichum siamense TaxID=690259 RepID=UPI001872F345|nr:uncharacterized protein CGCS363_v004738 [Colletotrichum siamense]KAF5505183.1 hypothetical protein CGCS363_v004738 [Colletotrichum siamense]